MTFAPPLADASDGILTGISRALDVPIRIAALLLLLVLVTELGRLAAETLRRHRLRGKQLEQVAAYAIANPSNASLLAQDAPSSLSERTVIQLANGGSPAARERALTHFELDVQRRLDRTRMLVRAGPAVGLMGTLIPLGPGIGALGRGDVASLAADLQSAFAATVVGILVGTVAFALTLVRTRRYSTELSQLEGAVELAPPGAAAPLAPVGAATP